MNCNVKITPEVQRVLESQISIDGNTLRLTGQLDRKLYESTNKILELLGGKWDKRTKGHVFAGNPQDAITNALEGGSVEDSKKKFQLFETPCELAETLATRILSGVTRDMAILEPSAGPGRLLYAVHKQAECPIRIHFCEIQADLAQALSQSSIGYFQRVGYDFLKYKPGFKYPRILMNPPFTRGQDVTHVMHAYENCLEKGGKLIAIMSPAVTFNGSDSAGRYGEFHKFLLGLSDYTMEDLPEGTFKSSGTNVRTCVVELNK